jgi:hypothetical protein
MKTCNDIPQMYRAKLPYCEVDEYVYLNRYSKLERGADGKLIPDQEYVCGESATIKHDGVWMCEPHYNFVLVYEKGGTAITTPRRD